MAEGRIVKALSGFYYVQAEDGIYACKGRGVFRKQKITPLVGDFVTFDYTDKNEGYIQTIADRKNELTRPPIANITQAVIVTTVCEPTFSSLLLDRFLVKVEAKNIKPIIVVTKKDLASDSDLISMNNYIADYKSLGYDVYFVDLKNQASSLQVIKEQLKDEVTVLIGQSGVGKSSLLNKISPNLQIQTGEISKSLGRGKHTTRHVELIEINEGLVADTPGFSSLEFTELEQEELDACFIEMKEYKNACKFRSCLHVKEPQCAIKQAVDLGHIKQYRYDHYVQFLKEIKDRKPRYSS